MDNNKITILWADDEIHLLKPYFLFLEEKDYNVIPVTDGNEALEMLEKETIDVIFLDENMPGLSGLETLEQIKTTYQSIPVIMITKSEEENIMEDAIGSHISDYLIKPVNPNQILLTLKKTIDHSRILREKRGQKYQQEFRKISMSLDNQLDANEWINLYKDIVYWDIELSQSDNADLKEMLDTQKVEANTLFTRFISDHYTKWILNPQEAPVMSNNIMSKYIKPLLQKKQKKDPSIFFIIIDNLRWDHWLTIKKYFTNDFRVKQESLYYSILPTTTHYSRNALLAGMLPEKIQRKFPEKWSSENDEGSKNNYEEFFLKQWIKDSQLSNISCSYHKVIALDFGVKLQKKIHDLFNNDFNVIIYNFVDMLSHASTDVSVVKEMAHDEKSYRGTVDTWLKNSSLLQIIQEISNKGGKVILSTDHGSVQIKKPFKVQSNLETNFNLRYKSSKSFSYDPKEVFEQSDSKKLGLPSYGLNHKYIFATNNNYFVYPNEYNKYVEYFKNTFQHGGVSLEEMLIPFIIMDPKK